MDWLYPWTRLLPLHEMMRYRLGQASFPKTVKALFTAASPKGNN